MFIEGQECPICKSSQFTIKWNGRVQIIDVNKSEVAKKIGITNKGEYAIKVW